MREALHIEVYGTGSIWSVDGTGSVGWRGAKGHQRWRLLWVLLYVKGGGLAHDDDGIFFVEMGKMAAQYGRRQGFGPTE